jgi:hypothetical protein
MRPDQSFTDELALKALKGRAPHTWAISAEFYEITDRWCGRGASDSERIEFANRVFAMTKAMEQNG